MDSLTHEQEQVLIGTIIGDGCIFKCKKARFHRLNLAHSIKQEQYFMMKFNILAPIVKTLPKKRSWIDARTNNEYHEIRLQSLTDKMFSNLYAHWYSGGKKILNLENLQKIDALGLAVIFFDDGYYLRGGGYLSMNNFDNKSIENFQSFLLSNFGLETKIHKGGSLYFKRKVFPKLKSIIKPFATPDVLYKLGELLES